MRNKRLLSLIALLMLPLAGGWVWPGLENGGQILGGLALASSALVCARWYRRVQAGRRWRSIWNAYAERDLARSASR